MASSSREASPESSGDGALQPLSRGVRSRPRDTGRSAATGARPACAKARHLQAGMRHCAGVLTAVAAGLERRPSKDAYVANQRLVACVDELAGLSVLLEQGVSAYQRMTRDVRALKAALRRSRGELRDSRMCTAAAQRTALQDPLTGLPNRLAFADTLDAALKEGSVEQRALGLLFIDLDRFKAINDQQGHAVGDELLRLVAARLMHAVRASDAVCRYGGDEFLCLLTEVRDEQDISHVARKMFDAVAGPYRLAERVQLVRPSIGVAVYPADGSTANALIGNADAAMYWAKKCGMDYAFFGGVPAEPLPVHGTRQSEA